MKRSRLMVALLGGALLALAAWPPAPAAAVMANPRQIYTFRQPDGSTLKARLFGDERLMYRETEDGYTIVQDTTGWWCFATLDTAGALRSGARVAAATAQGAGQPREKHLRPTAITPTGGGWPARVVGASGTWKLPIKRGVTGRLPLILVNWSGVGPAATYSVADFQNYGNSATYNGVGSMADYWREVSYGNYSLTVDVIGNGGGGWMDAATIAGGGTYAYFCNNASGEGAYPQNATGLVEAVVRAADAYTDFSIYDSDGDGYVDAVGIIYAGPSDGTSSTFWSFMSWLGAHAYTTNDGVIVNTFYITFEQEVNGSQAEIGTGCHEFGHAMFMFPDLYNTANQTVGDGLYCLMAVGNYAGSPQGRSPTHINPWFRKSLGWLSFTTLGSGSYSLAPIENTAQVYQLPATSTEYFLLEHRQPLGFDAGLPGSGGILIWHVDETMYDDQSNASNNDWAHKFLDVECANGRDEAGMTDLDNNTNWGSDAHYFRSGNNTQFSPNTNPSTMLYGGSPLFKSVSSISELMNNMTFFVSDAQTTLKRRAISCPNPFYPSTTATVVLRTDPIVSVNEIMITNLRGDIVRRFGQSEIGGQGYVNWDGRNVNGGLVASGVYLIVITDINNVKTSGRLTIVR